jgi:uncharacterized cupredoxin-like copper-binding protein
MGLRHIRAVVLLVAVLAACGGPEEAAGPATDDPAGTTPATEPAAAAVLEITATEFSFDHSAEVPAGTVTLAVDNIGATEHVTILSRIEEGATFDDALAAMEGPPEEALDTPQLGVGGVAPGASGNAVAVLEPGQYLLLCPLPTPDGPPHFAQGMVSELTVTEPAAAAELPSAEARVTATEFAFDGIPELGAGEHVVALDNAGEQEHELNLVELAEGKTIDDVIAHYSGPPGQGEPPMRNLGGPLINPATSQQVLSRFELEAGKSYAFICAVPDFSEQPPTPHVVKGMHSAVFTVE